MSRQKKKGPQKEPSRARIWCFTMNNPDEKDESQLSHEIFQNGIRSMVWQIEEGKNLTPHIQGVIQFKNQITFGQVKKKLPTAHLEVCRNFAASKLYCQKEEGRLKGPFFYPDEQKKMSDKDISLYWKKVFIPEYQEVSKEEKWDY